MSDAASPTVQTYTRPRTREFGDMPLDTVDLLDVMSGLSSLQLGVYMRLRASLWLRGALPVGFKALAQIGQVTPRTFERMVPFLAPLFDHDESGRWRDHALERKRGNRVVLAIEDRVVDPDLSAKRSAAGRAGAEAKRALRLVSSSESGEGSANGEANERSFASKTAGVSTKDSANLSASGQANGHLGPTSASKLASFLNELKESKLASELADSKPRAAASEEPVSAEPPSNPASKTSAEASAGAPAKTQANPASPTEPSPADAAIIDAVIRVCGGKTTKVEVHRRLPLFRAAIAEGLDFFKDILPRVEAFARNKERIENCANTHILAEAREHCASRRAVAGLGAAGSNGPAVVRIYKGTDAGNAYAARAGTNARFPIQDGERWYRVERDGEMATLEKG